MSVPMKDSAAEWLGEVPATWNTVPLRVLLKLRRDIVGADSTKTRLLSLTLHGVIERDLENPTGKLPASFDGYQRISSGEMVFCLFDMDETPRTVGVAPQDGMLTGAYTVFQPQSELWARYLYYFFLHVDEYKRLKPFYKGLRKTIRPGPFLSIQVPRPPDDVAAKIVALLDRTTARIDALVAKKTRFIQLLREKRQALITHAVTKGLDAGVPMKDSGVEWLGQIPAAWTATKVGFLAQKIGSGKTPSGGAKVYAESGVLFLRSQNIYDDGVRLEDVAFITPDVHAEMKISQVRPRDVLLNITGGSIGRAALVPDDFDEANVNQHVCIVRVATPSLARWVHMCFRAQSTKEQIDAMQSGANREGLNFEQVGNLRLALPPTQVIEATLEILDKGIERIETLIAKTEHSIELLREHRTALITAAVTGKLDLRKAT